MRVNIYAEEMTDRLEIITKEIEGHNFTALRFYLELPATVNGKQYQGPFMHRPGDDDSAAVTFWGKRDLRKLLAKGLQMLDEHYGTKPFDGDRLNQALTSAIDFISGFEDDTAQEGIEELLEELHLVRNQLNEALP